MKYFFCSYFSLRVGFWCRGAPWAKIVIFIFCPWALMPGDITDYAEEPHGKEAFLVLKEETWGGHMCIYFSPSEHLFSHFHMVCLLVCLDYEKTGQSGQHVCACNHARWCECKLISHALNAFHLIISLFLSPPHTHTHVFVCNGTSMCKLQIKHFSPAINWNATAVSFSLP